tara:strand:- start:109 stop:459 length:351 start_codon:yes stop_codon:yes gene_type:complete
MFSENIPTLIEPGTKYFLYETLKNCNKKKNFYYCTIFNIFLLIIFLTILGIFLFYKYKSKLTPKEKKEQKVKEQEYIMTKLRNFNEEAQKQRNLLITNLPRFDDNKTFVTRSKIFA